MEGLEKLVLTLSLVSAEIFLAASRPSLIHVLFSMFSMFSVCGKKIGRSRIGFHLSSDFRKKTGTAVCASSTTGDVSSHGWFPIIQGSN